MNQPAARRAGRVAIVVAGLLFAVFVALAVYHLVNRGGYTPEPLLQDELRTAVLLDGPSAPSGEWPQWLGPQRNGTSPESVAAWPDSGPKVLWREKVGPGYSGVVVAGGRAFTHSREGDQEVVIARDAVTGKELWRFGYPCSYRGTYGNGPRATPAVDGDRIVTAGVTGVLLCLEASSGKELWRHDLLAEFSAPMPQYGVAFSPLLDSERVYTTPGGSGSSLAAFDRETGRLLWKSQSDPAGYSSPILVTAGGVRQLVCFTGSGLVGVRPENGKLLWRFPWTTSFNVNAATPLAFQARTGETVSDYLFLSSAYDKGCAVLKVVPAGPDACGVRWVYESKGMQMRFATPVRVGHHLYGCSDPDPGMLTCLDVRTGEVKWKQRNFGKGSVLAAGGILVALSDQGRLVLAEANPESYQERARWQAFRGRTWTSPSLAAGRLYLRNDEEVVCIEVRRL